MLIATFGLSLLTLSLTGADPVDYVRDVKPILARHCNVCHGPSKPRAGLRLDTAAAAIRGESIVPGHADESSLIDAVLGINGIERMPLNRPPLSNDEIAALRRWIDAGAVAPKDETPDPAPPHWAFISPAHVEPPAIENQGWVRNPIDAFVLKRLEREVIRPSPVADRVTLLRRVSLDLIGLPPTPAEIDAYLADGSVDPYEKAVDRLLASPHYGERWARPWLDLARYADSNGYSIDAPRSIWPYRDWVINALNRDLPYSDFVIDQLAGDLRPDATRDQKVATGFHRNTPINQEGGIDVEQFRVESIIDRVNTTATSFLGLTLACAQCHDHKYDPLTQVDYYRLFAILNTCDEPEAPLATADVIAKRDAIQNEIESYLTKIWTADPTLAERQKAWEDELDMVGRQKQSQEVRTSFDVVFDKRTEAQQRTVFAAFIDQTPSVKVHRDHVAKLKKSMPKVVTSLVLREQKKPRVSHRLVAGDFTRLGEVVRPGVPAVLPPIDAQTPSRLDFARWLVDGRNPLTARVAVNRAWQSFFGRGLVETESDFGTQGAPPSHPELLDWLALKFQETGWSQKQLHRLIVCSSTYRQSSKTRSDLATIDPNNRLLARQTRLRLDAEVVRDAGLVASGLLNPKIGGPSVFPPQPDGVMALGQMRRDWTADLGPDRYRRGLYTYVWRATPHPGLTVFDAPEPTRSCSRRPRSITPLQALTLLNDQAFHEFATALGASLLTESASDRDRIDSAFRRALARHPSEVESARLESLLHTVQRSADEAISWGLMSRVLLNLDEFITRE